MAGVRQTDEPMRPPLQAVLIAAVVVMMGLGVVIGGRSILLSNHPRIDLVTEVPAKADRAQIMAYAEHGVMVPQRWSLWTMLARIGGAPPVPMLGWSVREVSFLGLPLFAYRELGDVVGVQGSRVAFAAPIGPEQIMLIERQAGPIRRGWFPFWEHCWGLLAFGCVAAAVALEVRFQAFRRRVLGLI